MARSVELTTPIPSAEEVADRLGLTKARREMLFELVDRAFPIDSGRTSKAPELSRPVQNKGKAKRVSKKVARRHR